MAYKAPDNPSPYNTPIKDILFLDLETVPLFKTYDEVPDRMKEIFIKRYKSDIEEIFIQGVGLSKELLNTNVAEVWRQKAALTPEFGKIACASAGYLANAEDGSLTLRIKGFAHHDEKTILNWMAPLLAKLAFVCAHNGKRFDFPMYAKRCLINGLPVPSIMRTMGLKPWEVTLFDTMEMWAFTDPRATASLDAIAMAFGLPSPKQEVSGADVAGLYYGPYETDLPFEPEDALKKIVTYCNGDVRTLANIYLMMISLPPISMENVVIVA